MRQFLAIKERVGSAIVFFRLGDFYEMFFEDAVIAAPLLDVVLTTRDKGKPNPIPMCGVPHFAARGYVAKLAEHGYSVAICEQVEDPKHAKGIVRREVVRIVTPGCNIDEDALTPWTACFVAALAYHQGVYGLAYLDISTGEFRATSAPSTDVLADELARVAPREIVADGRQLATVFSGLRRRIAVPWSQAPSMDVKGASLELGGLDRPALHDAERVAAGLVLAYARRTQPGHALPVEQVLTYQLSDCVVLSEAAISHLELVSSLTTGARRGSLFDCIDTTVTAAGARCLRRWLLYPLTEAQAICERQRRVADFVAADATREAVRLELPATRDLERLAGRIALRAATPRDFVRLRDALFALPALDAAMQALPDEPIWYAWRNLAVPWTQDVAARLRQTLADEPASHPKETGVIRTGFDAQIDELRLLVSGAEQVVQEIEARERIATGIATLRVRSNRVFGLYIEVSKGQVAKVPERYVRKQTVATGERYVTDELAALEERMATAAERLAERETALWYALVEDVARRVGEVSTLARHLAQVDALAALAQVAVAKRWCRPDIDDSLDLTIEDGRHPVVEAAVGVTEFVPNSCALSHDVRMWLLTGPNMAGKSTFMRQVAIIVVLAQMGSFVPASFARIGIVDRLFTRVGAADNLARGDSTFMVEMRETAAILAGATERSLIVFDEVGRGTATFDGLSIARAIGEYVHDVIGARTLFATHFHELTSLASERSRVANYSMAVAERDGDIVFLRRVRPGAAERSYGIDVARLAGLPDELIARARDILVGLEQPSQASMVVGRPAVAPPPLHPVLVKLAHVEPNDLSPNAAWQLVAQLRMALVAVPATDGMAVRAVDSRG